MTVVIDALRNGLVDLTNPGPIGATTPAAGTFTTVSFTGKTIAANGATTSYTVASNTAYVYLTTTAVSMAMTLPAGAAAIDGLILIVCPSAVIATVTWASSGTTFVGAPSAFAANTPVRMIYNHSDLKWYPW